MWDAFLYLGILYPIAVIIGVITTPLMRDEDDDRDDEGESA